MPVADRVAAVAEAASTSSPGAGRAGLSGLVVNRRPAGSLEETIFATVRSTLDAVQLEVADIDAVVIAADDVADGRAISTMLYATAAGAYLKDEIRVTGGSLSALALGAMRIASGASERVIVVAWWRPTAEVEEIARATLEPLFGRSLSAPQLLVSSRPLGAVASCVLTAAGSGELVIEGSALSQAQYLDWLTGSDEPDGCVRRLGERLRVRCGDLAGAAVLATATGWAGQSPWARLASALGARLADCDEEHYGLVDGLARLATGRREIERGERAIVAATGVPPFLSAEAVVVRMP